jgi:hypothetical protein
MCERYLGEPKEVHFMKKGWNKNGDSNLNTECPIAASCFFLIPIFRLSDLADFRMYAHLVNNSWRNPADDKKKSLKIQTQKNPALFLQLWSKLRAIIK